ncbi:MAG: hypothetical protein CMD31_13105 [Flavobacteriales bacterium]|nr:hypothetical protein [Flavobacteriales bacterium]|tara:strand:- start:40613 stop:41299 length:687 start_codon:yes stop_codon:yes gene_type:complete
MSSFHLIINDKRPMENKTKKRRSKFAQNKIAYIVYNRQKEARELVNEYGYEAPKDVHSLVETVKLLVKKKGIKAIKDLLYIHPDKKAILKYTQPEEANFCGACGNSTYLAEDNYCGGCGHVNFTGSTDVGKFLNSLENMETAALEKYYTEVLNKANKNPGDNQLADEVQLVWNQLRERMNKTTEKDDASENGEQEECSFCQHVKKSELVIAGVILATGILIGSAFRSN